MLTGTGFLGAIAFFVVYILFVWLGQPLWSLIDILRDPKRVSGSKALWGLMILTSWTLSGVIYGLFVTRSKKLWLSTLGSVMIALPLFVALIFAPTIPLMVLSTLSKSTGAVVTVPSVAVSQELQRVLAESANPDIEKQIEAAEGGQSPK